MQPKYHFIYQGKLFEPYVYINQEKNKIRCVKRREWLHYGPEEFVRQELLHFLLQVKKTCPIHIRQEWSDLDIVVYAYSPIKDFFPDSPPVLIIETKHDGIHLGEPQETQMLKYLKRARCNTGILTNGLIINYYQGDDPYQCKQLSTLDEIESLIRERVEIITQPWKADHERFTRAQLGCYESFKYLVKTYDQGWYTKFQLAIKEGNGLCTGSSFTFMEEEFRFRLSASPRTKKTYKHRDFQRLERIKPSFDLSDY
jgi:hypothetical protein